MSADLLSIGVSAGGRRSKDAPTVKNEKRMRADLLCRLNFTILLRQN